MPGTAADASTASTSGPVVNQCSDALSMLAATHSKRTGRFSINAIGSTSVSVARSASLPCRWVPVRASVARRLKNEPAKTLLRSMSDHVSWSRWTIATRRLARHRGAVDRTHRRADDEVGRTPALEQRAQHPDLAGPELPAAPEHERIHARGR